MYTFGVIEEERTHVAGNLTKRRDTLEPRSGSLRTPNKTTSRRVALCSFTSLGEPLQLRLILWTNAQN